MNCTARILIGLSWIIIATGAANAANLHERGGHGVVITHPDAIPHSYIIRFVQDTPSAEVPPLVRKLASEHGFTVSRLHDREAIFQHALKGFGAAMSDTTAATLARHPLVASVEQNARVTPSASRALEARQWNLDRIDQIDAVVNNDGTYVGDMQFNYSRDGDGRFIYVIDAGVLRWHQEFAAGQVLDGPNFASDPWPAWNPCNGQPIMGDNSFATHGTGVASIAAGQTLGVAPGAYIVPIKYVNCDGTNQLEWAIWGLDWIAQPVNPYPKQGAIAVISWYVRTNDNQVGALEWAIQQVIAAGVTVVVSANNHASDACLTSPARLAYGSHSETGAAWETAPHRVITVGGTGHRDEVWRCGSDCWGDNLGSNTGRCVDLYAPAFDLKVAHFGSTPYRLPGAASSGTSWSAPQVAGYAARVLQGSPNLAPAAVRDEIRLDATWLPFYFDGDSFLYNDKLLYAWPTK